MDRRHRFPQPHPGDGLPNPHVSYLIRVDLHDPDARLFSSPRLDDPIAGVQETSSYSLVEEGVNVGYRFSPNSAHIHRTNPRTALGISEDKRHLFIRAIDGRQHQPSSGHGSQHTPPLRSGHRLPLPHLLVSDPFHPPQARSASRSSSPTPWMTAPCST